MYPKVQYCTPISIILTLNYAVKSELRFVYKMEDGEKIYSFHVLTFIFESKKFRKGNAFSN